MVSEFNQLISKMPISRIRNKISSDAILKLIIQIYRFINSFFKKFHLQSKYQKNLI